MAIRKATAIRLSRYLGRDEPAIDTLRHEYAPAAAAAAPAAPRLHWRPITANRFA